MEKGENNRDVFIANIYAHRGRFKEAARLYQKAGNDHKALTMYTDLRMFDQAQVSYYLTINNTGIIVL